MTIDGYTQPGAEKNNVAQGSTNATLLIQLEGSDAGPLATGLVFAGDASNSVIRGLIINRFNSFGIICTASTSGYKIEGNFVGTSPSGTQDRGNGLSGVVLNDVSNSTIGGSTPAARNLISGNGSRGVGVDGPDNSVFGNLIGTKKDGTSALGNASTGVNIANDDLDDNNVIGSNVPNAANVIAFNGGDGARVFSGTGNSIFRNSIHSNGGLGIDLFSAADPATGVTANDSKDPDTGANNLQNFPKLTSAKNSGGQTTIEGSINSKPNTTFVIRFFSNPPTTREGEEFVGQKSVSTNANGNVSFTFSPAQTVPNGRNITATATDPAGNTSEFSGPRAVTSG